LGEGGKRQAGHGVRNHPQEACGHADSTEAFLIDT
jgi:hypothetical protein